VKKGAKLTLTYSATFKDHLAHPRNVGELSDATALAEETNPMCGDRLRLSLSLGDERIEDVKYLAYGCPPTLVCGSVLTELIQGKKISEVLRLTKTELMRAVGGLPSRKHHAAALAIETLQSALKETSSTHYTDDTIKT
jgi:nitrogen fixation protein NifU and related proteins